MTTTGPDFSRNGGLLPAIAQDAATGEVLMVAWMNAEAFAETMRTGQAVYFSRSRGKLWRKGEESGNVQEVKDAEAYKAYAAKVPDTLAPFGGKFIVRGAEPVILDASRKPPGYIVVIQFPSMKALRDWWNSPVYSSVRPIRERLTTGQNYAVEGLPPS